MTTSLEIRIDEVWSVVLRRIVPLEFQSKDLLRDKRGGYRYVLRKRGRDFRSYETFKELVEGARFLAGKNWDKVALRVASLIRDRQPDDMAEAQEPKGIPHWL